VTPYLTPDILLNAPTGISWRTVPAPGASPQQQLAEQLRICQRVTSEIDRECNQVLRATVDIDEFDGPDFVITVNARGIARMALTRWPVLSITSAQYCGADVFPRSWTTIPVDQLSLEYSTPGIYGSGAPDDSASGPNAVLVAPGYLDWSRGRRGWRLQVTYVNGWPHTSLTAAAADATTTLAVDDCTGWAGITGTLYDGDATEDVHVLSASVASGPGTLTLSAATTFPHAKGVLLTSMPAVVQQAGIYLAMAQALTRGATATTVQTLPGAKQTPGDSGGTIDALRTEARHILAAFRRVATA